MKVAVRPLDFPVKTDCSHHLDQVIVVSNSIRHSIIESSEALL